MKSMKLDMDVGSRTCIWHVLLSLLPVLTLTVTLTLVTV